MSSITLEQEVFSFGIEDYCKERDDITNKSPLVWLSWKQRLDKLHLYHTRDHPKLWRIHDQVYDFSKFKHPGGQAFLDLTVNTDITELFESSHPNIVKVRGYLDKYLVETAEPLHPRYTKKFTFDEKGFYCTLRERIFQALPQLPSISYFQSSAFVHDTFLVSFLVTVFLSVVPGIPTPVSYASMILSGILMACLGNASHNYFHLKDNWRMYTIDFTGFSSHEWRISHVYSHHTFSNTLLDVEIWGFEPIVSFLPWSNKKDPSTGFKVMIGVFLLFPLIGLLSFFKRMFAILTGAEAKRWENFLPLYLFMSLVYFRGILIASKNPGIALSYFIGGSVEVVALRLLITYLTCSSVFINLGLAGAHHHPSVWHAGDNTIEQKDKPIDWGLFQLMAVAYRPEVDESLILSSITFGRHSMHHLFPTIDLMYYPYLMPILEKTCKEFKVLDLCPLPREKSSVWSKRKTLTLWQGWLGMFKQAVRYETDITNFPPNI